MTPTVQLDLRSKFIYAATFSQSKKSLTALLKTKSLEAFRQTLTEKQLIRFDRTSSAGVLSDLILEEQRTLDEMNARFVTPVCSEWPNTMSIPCLLRVLGNLGTGPSLGVVGARNASEVTLHRAEMIGLLAAKAGLRVVSGGAVGVDINALTGAHKGGGTTLTVLGSGLGRPSPRRHLSHFIGFVERGAVISPFNVSQSATKWSFAKRNHVIAQLSNSLIVLGAKLGSGTMITARAALELKRPVFVFYQGGNSQEQLAAAHLLKEGARCAKDLLEHLCSRARTTIEKSSFSPCQQSILALMGEGTASVESLNRELNLGVPTLMTSLMEMQHQGFVARDPNGLWYRRGLNFRIDQRFWVSDREVL